MESNQVALPGPIIGHHVLTELHRQGKFDSFAGNASERFALGGGLSPLE